MRLRSLALLKDGAVVPCARHRLELAAHLDGHVVLAPGRIQIIKQWVSATGYGGGILCERVTLGQWLVLPVGRLGGDVSVGQPQVAQRREHLLAIFVERGEPPRQGRQENLPEHHSERISPTVGYW